MIGAQGIKGLETADSEVKMVQQYPPKHSLNYCLALLLIIAFLCCPSASFGAASGTISMMIDTDETGRIESVRGSTVLASDDTSWWDIDQWVGDYAQIDCYVDGQQVSHVLTFIYTRAPRYYDDLGEEIEFTWWPSQLDPGEHTISYRMRDVYSGEPYPSGGYRREIGNLITEYSAHVFVDDTADQYLRPIEERNLGFSGLQCDNMRGDPINTGTGNSFQQETDLWIPSVGSPLVFQRAYNSRSASDSPLGGGWTHTYNLSLSQPDDMHVKIRRADGGISVFVKNPEDIYQEISTHITYVEELKVGEGTTGWRWHRLDGSIYTFDPSGRLQKVTKHNNDTFLTYDLNNLLEAITDMVSGRSLQLTYNPQNLITQILGPTTEAIKDGIWVSFGYDSNRNLTSITYADGSGLNYTYSDPNDIHNLTEKRNKMGHLLSAWSYDDQDRVIENLTREARGVSVNYVSHNTVEVTDAYGYTRTYRFQTLNGFQMFSEAEGPLHCPDCGSGAIRRAYNSELRLTEVEYPNGLINQYGDFDSRGNARTVKLAVGTPQAKTITCTFHPETNVNLSQTEPSVLGQGNKVTIWDYDEDEDDIPNENPTQVLRRRIERGLTRDISGNVIPYEYTTIYTCNSKGQIVTIDGPLPGSQDTTTFSYDALTGDLLTVTRPLIGTSVYSEYDASGQAGRVIEPNGNAVIYTYDGRGRIRTITNESHGTTTTYDYNDAGELAKVTSPNGVTSEFIYDEIYGRLTRAIDPLGNYISYGYDEQGNRTEEAYFAPSGERLYWRRYSYQGPTQPGKLWKLINPDGTYTEYTYDSTGSIHSVKDPAGNISTYDYDMLSRLTSVTQPGDIITAYTYDSHDNLVTVTDAEGRTTTYLYDDLGRLVSTVSPDTNTTSHTYDEASNLASKTDANGNTVTYSCDALNRLTAIQLPDPSQNIRYTYDEGENGKGRLTGMIDPSGTYFYRYDAAGNLIRDEKTINAVAYITEYTYDEAGIPTRITYPSGRTVTYGLDPAGGIEKVTTTKDTTTHTLAENITYLPFGPTTTMSLGNGLDITYSYDQLYRLASSQEGSLYHRSYTYDPAGNITTIKDLIDPSRNQSFGYDSLSRLLTATGKYGSISYTYDGVGNRVTRTVDDQTEFYSYVTGTNRLREIAGPNNVTFTYDANGNTIGMADKTYVYNQNNRLIHAIEDSATLGEYIYNGQGQRVRKVADGQTTLFIYDKAGNLISEADENGKILKEYVYLEGRSLTQFAYEIPEEIEISITTNKGREVSGINVYAFTELGTYTGLHAVTNDQGVASFAPVDFTDGNFKFRADYLSYQFWSPVITIPGTYTTEVLIEEETAGVTVTVAGEEKQGVRVYLFNEDDSYLGLYGVTDGEGKVSFDLPVGHSFKFRADYMGNQYWSETTIIEPVGSTPVDIDTEGGILTVTLQKDADHPIVGVNVYLFTPSGSYLGYHDITDENGQVSYHVSEGDYKVRADYLGYQFWSDIINVNDNTSFTLTTPHQEVTITVEGDYDGDVELREGLDVYLFTPSGSYLSRYQVTDDQGRVTFNLPDKDYKVRADYISQQYWSEVFNWSDETITINEGLADVSVINMGLPLENADVYIFNSSGSYLGIYDVTDINGEAFFRLPQGNYNFRGDYMGSQYWSGMSTIIAHVENPVTISTGGGTFTLTVQKGVDDHLPGVNCYLFNESGSYLGEHGVTSGQGEVSLNLADGTYKIRVDYMGYQLWTEVFSVPDTSFVDYTIPHQDVTVTVEGNYDQDINAIDGIKVYLFSPSGSYLGLYQVTNEEGQVAFSLPEKDYKMRADYLSQKYWSDIFNWTDETITIEEGIAEVHMIQGSTPLENVNVYVFNSSGSYLGIHGKTNEEGIVSFRLPEATYKLRGDYQGSQYWATEPVNAHQVNTMNLDTGGGTFALTVEKEPGSPLINVPVYVFSYSGSYLGITSHTDDQGQVAFDLSDGDYLFRADYLGYQFWSDVSTIPTILSDTLTISHQDVTITVNEVYGYDITPLEGIPVYLFTSSGSYLGVYGDTDAQGQVIFNLPQEDYKVRADYVSGQYWSDVFNWINTDVDIDHGLADLHITFNGEELYDVPVYLFTESGNYLGRYERTNEYGHAEFLIPAKSYKFRVDYKGAQYWSDVVNIIAHEERDVDLPLEQLALNLTNDPSPVRFDGDAPVFEQEKIRIASIGSLAGILSQSIVATTTSPNPYYYLNDHLGTPQVITDENGEVVWRADYRPFGDVDVQVSNIANSFRFPGQYYDEETGLHYNYHRYYDPGTARYISPDPSHSIQPRGSSISYLPLLILSMTRELAPYPYASNNPIKRIDPLGLIWVTIDVDYHGVSNWSRGILRYIGELINKGQLVFPSDESFVGATRTITQMWEADPDEPCKDFRYSYGTLRVFDQTYMKHMRGPNDLTNNFPQPLYYQWRPYVSARTYIDVPAARIIDRTTYIQRSR